MDTFGYFRQISAIPRESGNEEGMRRYLLAWAEENGLEAQRDMAGNIIIRKPATNGYEKAPSVALQGHMDMVCVKTAESRHNFLTDPIDVYEDGDFLKARGTSLGGDNGIAVAMVMALFTDPTSEHGPLEAIFTCSEETGMDGAFGLDGSLIQSRRLINLDSEEEGIIYIGCAGGIDLVGRKLYSVEKLPEGWDTIEVNLSGLKGGHSGAEIHKGRLNAVSALARMLVSVEQAGVPFRISAFNGGTKRNVIPSVAGMSICLPLEGKETAVRQIMKTFGEIKEENRYEEPDISMAKRCTGDGAVPAETAMGEKDSIALAKAIFTCPHGVSSMSKAIPGIVETSDNLAIVNLDGGKLDMQVSVRSSIDSAKHCLVNRIKVGLEGFGIECKVGDGYPAWTPDPESRLARLCADAYEERTGRKPLITAIHAGLECGVINSKCPGMDSVSIGPDMFDIHSTSERLSISSTRRTYEFVRHLLSIMK